MAPPTEQDIAKIGNQLMHLPFRMAAVGHTTVAGHKMYVHGQPLLSAYLEWIASNQSEESWQALIDAWGGEELFHKIVSLQFEDLPTV